MLREGLSGESMKLDQKSQTLIMVLVINTKISVTLISLILKEYLEYFSFFWFFIKKPHRKKDVFKPNYKIMILIKTKKMSFTMIF